MTFWDFATVCLVAWLAVKYMPAWLGFVGKGRE